MFSIRIGLQQFKAFKFFFFYSRRQPSEDFMVSVSGGICQQGLPGNCGTSFVANIPTSESTVKRLPLQRLAGSS